MRRKIFITIGSLLVAFLLFSLWMSPRLGGLIAMGKERPDSTVEKLIFDTTTFAAQILTYASKPEKAELKTLREKYQLDTVIHGAQSDFEKISKIQSWVQSRWKHDGENRPEKNDALYILEQAEKGKRFRCVEYSIVASACLASLGYTVRNIGLMTKDISEVKSGAGHAVNEVYLTDLKKWIFIDPQFDVAATYNDIPLNAVELQECIANDRDFKIINPNNVITRDAYKKWIGPYLYYFYTSIGNQRISIWDRMVGNKKQLTLYAIGAKKPTYFQKLMRINTSYYTHNTKDFYPVLLP